MLPYNDNFIEQDFFSLFPMFRMLLLLKLLTLVIM
jgi:hypothetical protein